LQVERLPHPENWKSRSLLAAFGVLIFVAGSVYSVVQSVIAMNRDDYVAAMIAGGFAVFSLGLVVAIAAGKLRSNTLRAASDSTGTTLRSDPIASWFLGISMVGAIVSAALYVIFVPRGEVELPLTTPGREGRNLFLMWSLLTISAIGLIALIVRGGSGYLCVAPHGVENADVLHTRKVSWDDIVDVTDEAPKTPSRHPIVLVMKNNERPIVVPNASSYSAGGAALYWMIRHYWKHPENRTELADGRALERLRNEQFEAE
jgi:hypothetical protein